jgi:arabinofuranosyltransferase
MGTARAQLRRNRMVLVALLGSCGILLVGAWLVRHFTLDDAYITLRYGKNLAAHGVLSYNVDDSPRVEGYSTLAWVCLAGALHAVGIHDALLGLRVCSLLSGVGTLIATERLAATLYPNSVLARIVPPFALALSPAFWLWSASGMETTFYAFAVTSGLTSLIRAHTSGRLSFSSLAWLGLVSVTRTEGVILYVSVVLVLLVMGFRGDRRYLATSPRFFYWNICFLGVFAAYFAARAFYYGSLVPLPVVVKRPAGIAGVQYVAAFLLAHAPWLILGVAALVRSKKEFFAGNAFLVSFLGWYLLAFSFTNPIVGEHFRLVLAAVPIVLLIAAGALETRGLPLALSLAATVAGLLLSLRQVPDALEQAEGTSRILSQVHIPVARALAADAKPGATVALADAGAIPYLSGLGAIDFFGLNDPVFAREGFDPSRVIDRDPSYIVLKSKDAGRFRGTDSAYGHESDAIYALEPFQKNYQRLGVFECAFYSFWVFRKVDVVASARRAHE